ncbi:MAG TPA: hypothetical protein VLH39_02520, partial [Magnetospirillaceae bacterium]|nr:hypothetical protein [Magnetospirillaceae bacterium]
TLLASAATEPSGEGYRVSYRSYGENAAAYEYSMSFTEKGLVVTAGGVMTGFRYDPEAKVFSIPWENGLETHTKNPDGTVRSELVLDGRRAWSARLYRKDGILRFEDFDPDGTPDRVMELIPEGPDTWTVSFTGSADSYYDGRITGASLFPRGAAYPPAIYNLLVVMDFWISEERFPFFSLSLLD